MQVIRVWIPVSALWQSCDLAVEAEPNQAVTKCGFSSRRTGFPDVIGVTIAPEVWENPEVTFDGYADDQSVHTH